MSENVTISLIGAMATVAVSVVNALLALSSQKRGKRNEGHILETRENIRDIKNKTNGLLDAACKAEFQKGVVAAIGPCPMVEPKA